MQKKVTKIWLDKKFQIYKKELIRLRLSSTVN